MYEHTCLGNINSMYESSESCDNKQQYKYIIESFMVSTTTGIANNITVALGVSVTLKNPSARELLSQFSLLLNIKQQNSVHRMGDSQRKRNITRTGSDLWSSIPKRRGNTKINACVKRALYNWV